VKYVFAFFRFWYEFIVGDDWRVAAGVAAAIGLTALLEPGVEAWWLPPVAVVLVLYASLFREVGTEQ
jgi:hypothetical protein